MTDLFEDVGYLSPDGMQWRIDSRSQASDSFAAMQLAVQLAISELKSGAEEVEAAYLIGTAFWLRCIEAFQATVLLAEQGLPTAPWSTMRVGYECLFAACAIWRKPDLSAKLDAAHHAERGKQARALFPHINALQATTEQVAILNEAASEPEGQPWSHFEAAQAAGLTALYQSVYRGSGMGGAHASLRSLDSFSDGEADEFRLHLSRSRTNLEWILGLVTQGLRIGIERRREAIAKSGFARRDSRGLKAPRD